MNILIAYSSTEGQTRKICRFCADVLIGAGHSVELLQAQADDTLDTARYDAAILAASIHIRKYQSEMAQFATQHGAALSAKPLLFLSVSLAAAGNDPAENADLAQIAQAFCDETGLHPARIEQVAGAFRFTQYDFFKSWAMRWMASQHGETVDPNQDKEYTDWPALRRTVEGWAAQAGQP